MTGRLHRAYAVRLTHRKTGVAARASQGAQLHLSFDQLRREALRLLRARLWQHRHRFGPQPIVRTYDLIDGDRAALIELLDGKLPGDP